MGRGKPGGEEDLEFGEPVCGNTIRRDGVIYDCGKTQDHGFQHYDLIRRMAWPNTTPRRERVSQ